MICKLSRTSNSSRLHEFGGLFKLYLWSLNTSYVSVFVPLRAKTTSTSFLLVTLNKFVSFLDTCLKKCMKYYSLVHIFKV